MEITNISADFIGNESGKGGAIYNSTSTGTISTIEGAFNKNKAKDDGGAISNNTSAKITTINSEFEQNEAKSGGAVSNTGSSTITTLKGTFKENKATEFGGAIDNNEKSTLGDTADYTSGIEGTYEGNLAKDGGAIANRNNSNISYINGEFKNNEAENQGGAIYSASSVIGNKISEDDPEYEEMMPMVTTYGIGGTFENNKAKDGGAIYASLSQVMEINGTFKNNTALRYGGAIDFNGSQP